METYETANSGVDKTIEKSEDDFEFKITYISAGALGLSLAFFDKIGVTDNVNSIILLILSWVFLSTSLFVNLISHLIVKKHSFIIKNKLIEVDLEDVDQVDNFNNYIEKTNKRSNLTNYASVLSLALGVFFIILFASLNILNSEKSTKKNDCRSILIENSNIYFLNSNHINLKK